MMCRRNRFDVVVDDESLMAVTLVRCRVDDYRDYYQLTNSSDAFRAIPALIAVVLGFD